MYAIKVKGKYYKLYEGRNSKGNTLREDPMTSSNGIPRKRDKKAVDEGCNYQHDKKNLQTTPRNDTKYITLYANIKNK